MIKSIFNRCVQLAPVVLIAGLSMIALFNIMISQASLSGKVAEQLTPPDAKGKTTLIRSAAEHNTTEVIFRVEEDVSELRFGGFHCFWEEEFYPSVDAAECRSLKDINPLLYAVLSDLGKLIELGTTSQRNVLVLGAISFFLIQTHIFRQRRCAKSIAASVTGALFIAGLFFGIIA